MRWLWTISIVFLLALAIPSSASAELLPNEVANSASYNYSQSAPTVQTTRAVFIELYTASWCVPCVEADEKLVDLSKSTPRSELVTVSQYADNSGSDPAMASEDSADRMQTYYNRTAGFPFAYFDGMNRVSGSTDSKLAQWDDNFSVRSQVAADYTIELEGAANNTTANYSVTVSQTTAIDEQPRLFVMLVEDEVHHRGTNGVPTHHYVVRMIDDGGLMDFSSGDHSATGSWDVDSGWNESNLSLVVLVQMDHYELPPDDEPDVLNSESNADGSFIPGFGIGILIAAVMAVLVAIVFVRRSRDVPDRL